MEARNYPTMSEGVPVFKVVVIGDSGVGKTNIITRYLSDTFTEEENQTIAVQFFRKKVESRTLNYWIHIWDTGGQARYEAITTVYYRGSKAVIIVFDLTNRSTFLSVTKWYDKIKCYTDTSKVIVFVIGNKAEKDGKREVQRSEIDKMVQTIENSQYFECSAKKGFGIEKMFVSLGISLNETGVRDKFKLDINFHDCESDEEEGKENMMKNPSLVQEKNECLCNADCTRCTIL